MEHYHMYRKFKTPNGKTLWRCLLPECRHAFYGNELMAGRDALCWKCRMPFKIRTDRLNRLQVKPICEKCADQRKKSDRGAGMFGSPLREKERELSLEEKLARLNFDNLQ